MYIFTRTYTHTAACVFMCQKNERGYKKASKLSKIEQKSYDELKMLLTLYKMINFMNIK